MTTRYWLVRGTVQGVGFRWLVRNSARRLGVRGWVRNRSDGAVEMVVQGTTGQLEQLRELLEAGNGLSRIMEFQEREHPAEEFDHDFQVRF